MPWPSGGKRGARLARHGMSSSRVLATIFASWPLTPRIAMDGFTVLIRRRKVHDQMVWDSTTLRRRSPFLSTQRVLSLRALAVGSTVSTVITNPCARSGKMLCRMTFIGQARDKLLPRLIPLSGCGNTASRYLVLSDQSLSLFSFVFFLFFF